MGHEVGARETIDVHPGIDDVATTHLSSPTLRAGPLPLPRIRGRTGVVNDLSHFGELEPEDIALPAERMCALRRKLCQRGTVVLPIRVSSIERAHWRPSRIAQTTRDWPRRMSPAANSFGTLVL